MMGIGGLGQVRGECVLLIEGLGGEAQVRLLGEREQAMLLELADNLPPKTAASIMANYLEKPKRELYDWLLAQKA